MKTEQPSCRRKTKMREKAIFYICLHVAGVLQNVTIYSGRLIPCKETLFNIAGSRKTE